MMAVLCVVDANRKEVLSTEDIVKLEYTDDTFMSMKNARDLKLKWVKVGLPGYVKCTFIDDNYRVAYVRLTNQFVPTITGKSFNIKKGAFFISRAQQFNG